MKYTFTIIFLIFNTMLNANENKDSLKIIQMEAEFKILKNQLLEVKRDQINYSIEKDIYKEVYKNNYERINLTITFVLGIFGVLGFLGFKNINSIRKEYNDELQEFKLLRNGFEKRIVEFNSLKDKYDSEIESISKTNIDQNIKIQLLELKEKIKAQIKNKEYNRALETALVTLEITPNDITILKDISIIYCRLGSYKDSIRILKRALDIEPENIDIVADLIEIYYFNNQVSSAKKLINQYSDWIDESRKLDLQKYFNILDLYHNNENEELKSAIIDHISSKDLKEKVERFDWDFDDVHHFHVYVKYPEKESTLLQYIWYLQGESSGQEVIDEINNVS